MLSEGTAEDVGDGSASGTLDVTLAISVLATGTVPVVGVLAVTLGDVTLPVAVASAEDVEITTAELDITIGLHTTSGDVEVRTAETDVTLGLRSTSGDVEVATAELDVTIALRLLVA